MSLVIKGQFGLIVDAVREKRPVIHHLTNYVTAGDCANITFCAGASPGMADEAEGGVEIVRDRIGHAGRAARPHFCHGDGLPSSVVPAPGGPARGENHFYISIVPLTCSCRQPLPARRSADRRAG